MSFIVVKHGKEQEHIFNANCKSINLLTSIKDVCGYSDFPVNELDLAEEWTGQPVTLNTILYEYADTLLQPRGVYVLITLHKDEHGHIEYLPLMDSRSSFVVKVKSPRKTKEELKKKTDKMKSQKLEQDRPSNAPRRLASKAESSLKRTLSVTSNP